MKIAIIAVAYSRVDSLSRLLLSLDSAYYEEENIPLIISIDKSKTDIVERFADNYQWKHGNKIVKKHSKNMGLREHMLSLGRWFTKYDALIVLEDDIVVSPSFYIYSKQAIDKYYNCNDIAGISLYSFNINYQTTDFFVPIKSEYDVYFMNCAMSWGEIWMKNQWMEFYKWYQSHLDFPCLAHLPQTICKWEKSWLKYHTRYCIETNKYFVHPYVSLTTNCSDVGTHAANVSTVFQVPLQFGKKTQFILPDLLDENVVFYDGFFENKRLCERFGIKEAECCIALNGMKGNRLNRRYWLTTKVLNFKIIKSFGLRFRPIEENIFSNIFGSDIFLYDTNIIEYNSNRQTRSFFLYNHYIGNIIVFIRRYGVIRIIRDFLSAFMRKIIRY